jgi:hypothetical protein
MLHDPACVPRAPLLPSCEAKVFCFLPLGYTWLARASGRTRSGDTGRIAPYHGGCQSPASAPVDPWGVSRTDASGAHGKDLTLDPTSERANN